MSSNAAEDIDATYERLDKTFPSPEADAEGTVSPEPREYVTSKKLKEEAEEARSREEESKRSRDPYESLSSKILFSVATVAVIGAIITIAKKLRET